MFSTREIHQMGDRELVTNFRETLDGIDIGINTRPDYVFLCYEIELRGISLFDATAKPLQHFSN